MQWGESTLLLGFVAENGVYLWGKLTYATVYGACMKVAIKQTCIASLTSLVAG